jgi:hypothetical protein
MKGTLMRNRTRETQAFKAHLIAIFHFEEVDEAGIQANAAGHLNEDSNFEDGLGLPSASLAASEPFAVAGGSFRSGSPFSRSTAADVGFVVSGGGSLLDIGLEVLLVAKRVELVVVQAATRPKGLSREA